MFFVLDVSVTVEWAFDGQNAVTAYPALSQIQASFASAPLLWQFEVASVLRKALKDGRLTQREASSFIADLSTLDIRLDSSAPSIELQMELAQQFHLTTYDAAYLELAMRLSQPLATLDDDLAKAARKAGVPLLLKI
jgi:predicted nucleic acid-binding protein